MTREKRARMRRCNWKSARAEQFARLGMDAQVVYAEIAMLADKLLPGGFDELVPSPELLTAIVDRALSDPNCPWRPYMTLDRDTAAAKQNLREARDIIAALEVQIIRTGGEVREIECEIVRTERPFVNIAGAYTSIDKVTTDEDLYARWRKAGLRDLAKVRKTYARVKEFHPLWDLLDKIKADLE